MDDTMRDLVALILVPYVFLWYTNYDWKQEDVEMMDNYNLSDKAKKEDFLQVFTGTGIEKYKSAYKQ